MGQTTGVSWANHTFNPWIGCAKVSEGCAYCYAESEAANRYKLVEWGRDAARRLTSANNWKQPPKWNRFAVASGTRPRVFCASWADVFESGIPPEWRSQLFAVIERTPALVWMLLTKRIENVLELVPPNWREKFPEHVWIGATVENQRRADERLPILAKIPAAVRFVSAEPLLESIDISGFLPSVQWVIVGGESGPTRRVMCPTWAQSVGRSAIAAGVPLFFKQFSALKSGDTRNGLFDDGEQWQQFPN